MPNIDFSRIRVHDKSQNEGFEELCCQLLSLVPQEQGSTWVRKRGAGGDGGVEGYWTLPSGQEHCLQSKFFFELEQSQRNQLTKSVKQMLEKHPSCIKYTVTIPFNLSDARQGRKWSQRKHWNSLVDKWKEICPNRSIEFELWDASKLSGYLAVDNPHFSGRRLYWFNDKILNSEWFTVRAEAALANLGPRYTPEMHVDLPLDKKFAAIVRCEGFWASLADLPDLPRSYSSEDGILELERSLRSVVSEGQSLIASACQHKRLEPELSAAADLLSNEIRKARDYDYGDSKELYSAWYELTSSAGKSSSHLDECHVNLARTPAVLVLGKAGVGKSHLLADATSKAISEGRPAILLLGQQLKSGQPLPFVKNSLGIESDFDQFLGALDSAAQSKGCRALFSIDALNEGAGISIWPDELAGFAEKLAAYPNIVFVASCRDTYQRRICRNLVGHEFTKLWHLGFLGHEDAAAKMYMDRKGISRPDAPFLDPEFSNPLFLKTICESVERKGETSFPKGLRGVTNIFEYYLGAITEAIEARLDLDPDQGLVRRAMEKLIDLFLLSEFDHISRDDAYNVVESVLPSFGSREKSLLHQLKSEGVFSDDLVYADDGDTKGREVIRFTYERYLDHFRAERFLESSVDRNNVAVAFRLSGAFRDLIRDRYGAKRGIIFALAIQIPEKFGTELISLVEISSDHEDRALTRTLREATKSSILWRDPKSCSKETLKVLNEHLGGFGPTAFEIILRCATEPEHPFNASLLHRNLIAKTMPERDQIWTTWCVSEWYPPEEGSAVPIWALVDWAFAVDPSKVDDERACLACTTLCWLFSSPRRSLRDRATKAVSALLERRISLARRLLLQFDAVDDFYILERVYAVVYACALHVGTPNIAPLVRTVVNRIFRGKQKYDHLLLREYALGIVQLGEKLTCLPSNLPDAATVFVQARNSRLVFPDPTEIEAMKEGVEPAYWSVMSDDFGTYIMSDIFHFSSTRLDDGEPETWQQAQENFLETLEAEHPGSEEVVAKYEQAKCDERDHLYRKSHRDSGGGKSIEWVIGDDQVSAREVSVPEYDEDAHNEAKRGLQSAETEFIRLLSADEQDHWRWLSGGARSESVAKFSRRKAKRWVIKKVAELGWTADRFQDFERTYSSASGRNEHDAERMGKKYQWIAYHRLLAQIVDRYHYFPPFEEDNEFLGAWQLGRRDIDPSFIHPGTQEKANSKDCWWLQSLSDVSMKLPKDRVAEWIRDTSDLPTSHGGALASNPSTAKSYFVLDAFQSSKEPQHDFGAKYRMLSEFIHSVIVRSNDVEKLVDALRNKSLVNTLSHPQEWSGYGFIGEYDWHQSWHFNGKSFWPLSELHGISGAPDIHLPCRSYSCEGGGYDKSVADTVTINLPSQLLIEDLHLSFNRRKFTYSTPEGTLAFLDPAAFLNASSAALIDQELLSKWLRDNDFTLVTSITYMKNFLGMGSDEFVGELIDCQLSTWNGAERSGERWTILVNIGPDERLIRRAFKI